MSSPPARKEASPDPSPTGTAAQGAGQQTAASSDPRRDFLRFKDQVGTLVVEKRQKTQEPSSLPEAHQQAQQEKERLARELPESDVNFKDQTRPDEPPKPPVPSSDRGQAAAGATPQPLDQHVPVVSAVQVTTSREGETRVRSLQQRAAAVSCTVEYSSLVWIVAIIVILAIVIGGFCGSGACSKTSTATDKQLRPTQTPPLTPTNPITQLPSSTSPPMPPATLPPVTMSPTDKVTVKPTASGLTTKPPVATFSPLSPTPTTSPPETVAPTPSPVRSPTPPTVVPTPSPPTARPCATEGAIARACIPNQACADCLNAAFEALPSSGTCQGFVDGLCPAITTTCSCGFCEQEIEDFYGCVLDDATKEACSGGVECGGDPAPPATPRPPLYFGH